MIRLAHTYWLVLLTLLVAGCVSVEQDRAEGPTAGQTIERILSEPLDEGAYGPPQACLSRSQYRDYQVLDDRHILFEGRGDNLWINRLGFRCPELRDAMVLRVRSTLGMGRICEFDRFHVGAWFDWPWYRRWPWHWGRRWEPSTSCVLGKFQPIAPAQLEAIEVLPEATR